MKTFFIRDGKLTRFSSMLVIFVPFVGITGTLYFQPPFWFGVAIFVVSLLVGSIAIAEGAAVSVGLKPFTNDPLGWRKAKESYKENQSPEIDQKTEK